MSAVEEYPDGAKEQIDELVRWSHSGSEATLGLLREELRPKPRFKRSELLADRRLADV